MTLRLRHLLAVAFAFATISPVSRAVSQEAQKAPAQTAKKSTPAMGQSDPDAGQRVFEQNCSRCHTAPDGFPARISGTVAMHMRVRASLSEANAHALLRFLNP
jgi:mono/diheme cytochrome c family protein